MTEKPLQVRKTPTEADYLYPTGFDVTFHASCYVTVRVGAFTKEEAREKVGAMLTLLDKRYDKNAESILGVPAFEDNPAVNIEITHISKQERKGLYASRVDLSREIICDWLIDPDEFPDAFTAPDATLLASGNQNTDAGEEATR